MAMAYKTPGVYVEEIPKLPPSVAPVATAVPAFIGYTAKADKLIPGDLSFAPTRITSMLEYETFFGGPENETSITVNVNVTTDNGKQKVQSAVAGWADESKRSKHVMYYAMQMYFFNGGGPCYIVSVGSYGKCGDAPDDKLLQKGLDTLRTENEPTLIIFPEAQNLTIDKFGPLQNLALKQCADLQDRFVIMDAHGGDLSLSDPNTNLLAAVGAFRNLTMDNLNYGACYAPNIVTTLGFAYDEGATQVVVTDLSGAAPPPAAASGKGGGAAASGGAGGAGSAAAKAVVSLASLKGIQSEQYEAAKAAINAFPLSLPPSSAIAGIYASVDNARGVWKSPANVGVGSVSRPAIKCTNADQADINVDTVAGKSVNVIRSFVGKGTLVWGARTLAGNSAEWRYVNVRRLFIFVETSVRRAVDRFVFEANDAHTWVAIQATIENFLTNLWTQGALQGMKPEHAFYVAVGLGKTMTAQDILEGRLIVEVGMAAVRPAEFIVLRFSHKMAES